MEHTAETYESPRVRAHKLDYEAFLRQNVAAQEALACLSMGAPEEAQVNATLALAFQMWMGDRT